MKRMHDWFVAKFKNIMKGYPGYMREENIAALYDRIWDTGIEYMRTAGLRSKGTPLDHPA